MTPPEILALGREVEAPNAEGWQVRVVPNKFPAFSLDYEGPTDEDRDAKEQDGLYVTIPAVGIHEVLVETPEHDSTFGEHSESRVEDILAAILSRFRALKQDDRIKYLQVFKNWGRAGGRFPFTYTLPADRSSAGPKNYTDRIGLCQAV